MRYTHFSPDWVYEQRDFDMGMTIFELYEAGDPPEAEPCGVLVVKLHDDIENGRWLDVITAKCRPVAGGWYRSLEKIIHQVARELRCEAITMDTTRPIERLWRGGFECQTRRMVAKVDSYGQG